MAELDKVPFWTGMRRMFYAVTPNETSFRTVQETPQVIDEATPFFFVLMILELIVCAASRKKTYRLSDALTSISAGMFSKLPLVVFRSVLLEGYVWVYQNYRVTELPWDSPWTWWLTFFGVDMAYYWFHRFAHEVNFLWAAHQVHHSSEDYNLSTALRQSVLQGYTSWVFYLPMALMIPPPVCLVHQGLNIVYQFWIHTELITTLGPLEYILNTPSHHRVHHGRNPYCIDKNYAGVLIIWDRMFGTFASEGETVAYGLVHPLNTFEPFYVQFAYPKSIVRRFLRIRGLGNKLKVLLCGPGWAPGKPRTGDVKDLPQIEKPMRKYHVSMSGWMSIYVFIHFFIFAFGNQNFMVKKASLSQTSVLVFLGYCFFSLTCFGRLFDNSKSGYYLEIVRCALFIVGDIVMCQLGFYGNKGYRPAFLYGLQVLFALSIGVCVAKILGNKLSSDLDGKKK